MWRTMLAVLIVAGCFCVCSRAFVVVTTTPNTRVSARQTGTMTTTSLHLLADYFEKKEQQEHKEQDDNSWTAVEGGYYLPQSLSSINKNNNNPSQRNKILEITDLQTYKDVVVDGSTYTVVRFYAPWCRSCQRQRPHFVKMAERYNSDVQFVQVPLTKHTAALIQALNVHSFPYAHLYHPEAGLVEERKLSPKVNGLATFGKILQTYLQGWCPVEYECNKSCTYQ